MIINIVTKMIQLFKLSPVNCTGMLVKMIDDNVDGGDDDVDGGDDDVDGAVEDVDGGVEDQVGVKLRGEGQDNLVPGCQVVGICHPNLMVVSSSTSSPSSYHIILIFFTATNMFTDQEPCSRECYS